MMTINAALNAQTTARPGFFRGLPSFRREEEECTPLMLRGIEVEIQTDDKVYLLSSETPPAESSDLFQATAWPRWVFRLPNGASFEQQMVLPPHGNAIAFSWRLLGESSAPTTLAVTPVFSVDGLATGTVFQRESDARGGRLTWRPNDRLVEIVADTNGQNRAVQGVETGDGARPATFEFTLARRPAVLIFSLAPQPKGESDPIIGGFLAQLAEEPRHAEPVASALLAA